MPPKKKPNLAAALEPKPNDVSDPKPVAAISNDVPAGSLGSKPRTYREDKKQIGGWFPVAVSLQLDELRLRISREKGRKLTLNELQAEAYNDLFKKYGMAEIAPGAPE